MSFNFIEDNLKNYEKEKQKCIDLFIKICLQDVGKKELAGNRGEWVDEINKWMGVPLGSNYCLSWILFNLKKVSDETGWTFGLPKSAGCKDFANRTKDFKKFEKPEVGDIVIYGSTKDWTGHATVCFKVIDSKKIGTIEANTSPSSDFIDRNGGGVFKKERPISGIGDLKLFAIIRPTEKMFRKNKITTHPPLLNFLK